MILSFKHRGLRALYNSRYARRVTPEHVRRRMRILALLDRSSAPQDMNLSGFRLHPRDRKALKILCPELTEVQINERAMDETFMENQQATYPNTIAMK